MFPYWPQEQTKRPIGCVIAVWISAILVNGVIIYLILHATGTV